MPTKTKPEAKDVVVFRDIFMDPDMVGESAYRALHDHAAEVITPEGGNAMTPVDGETVLSVDNLELLEAEFANLVETAAGILRQVKKKKVIAVRLAKRAQISARRQ